MTSIGDNSNIDEVGGMDQEQNTQAEPLDRADTIEVAESGESTNAVDLEEATLDPAALIEAQQEYGQAEAIEAAVTDLIDAAESEGASAPPTEEVSAAAQDWSISGDADDRPTEEVGSAAQGWSISGDADDRPTEEVGPASLDRTTSGDADDRPTEEVGAAAQDWSTSGDADDRPTEEMTSGIEGESKDDRHADEFADHKPIPAEEAALDLDGKGPDIAEDPVVKGDLEEGVILEGDADEGVWPKVEGENVWPKFDSPSDLVDFKFFKVEGQAGQEGSLIAKDNAYLEGLQPSQSMEAALGRAVIDPAFRQELLDDAQGALAEYELSDEEVSLLGQINPEGLQQVAGQIKAQFENIEDPAAQTVLGRIISDVLSSGAGVLKGE